MKKVWVSPLAGKWYQDSRAALEYDMECLCRDISVVRKRTVCAAVAPHAAYRYSGRAAAGVFLRIDPRAYGRIVLLGPSHYDELRNRISALDATHILTPLGELEADRAWLMRFAALPFAASVPSAHAREHACEIQLPLIQHCLSGKIPVACLICGRLDADRLSETADALRPLLDDRTLVVVSSDFTHFGPRFGLAPPPGPAGAGADGGVSAGARSDGGGAFGRFASGDLPGFLKQMKRAGHDLCVRDPLPLLMALLPEGARVSRTGGGDYAGAIVEGRWSMPARLASDAPEARGPLTPEEGARLVECAAAAIARAFRSGIRRPVWGIPPAGLPPRLRSVRGGFVTIMKGGVRLGCMGEAVPRRPIWRVAAEQALNAAFHDARVAPLSEEEWPACSIEVDVLSAPAPAGEWRSIRPAEQGILLSKGGAGAVRLPRPPAAGETLEQTLGKLARKAGLPEDGWREGAALLVFRSQRFAGPAAPGRTGKNAR